MDVLKFLTAGSVDSGKSTLIGRLLYDSKNIPSDQLKELPTLSGDQPNLAFITDGLRAERQQGITIDVAYRYFSTQKRKFIVADAPGHQEFTRNLFTGASNCSLMIILIEANKSLNEQTHRHCLVASLLQIPLLVAINKMDTVGFSEKVFVELQKKFSETMAPLKLIRPYFLPVCALQGDNVVDQSSNMSWYKGKTILEFLNSFEVLKQEASSLRFYIQNVFDSMNRERFYTGRIQCGKIQIADRVICVNTGQYLTVKNISILGERSYGAFSGDSIALTFTEDATCNRGDLLCNLDDVPEFGNEFKAVLCWFDDSLLESGKQLLMQYGTAQTSVTIRSIKNRMDINSFKQIDCANGIRMNDVAEVTITTDQPVSLDSYAYHPSTGVAILIDLENNKTVAGILKQ